MNTPSHFIMTATLRKALPKLNMPRGAVWLGSVMPDLPLYVLAYLRTHEQSWGLSAALSLGSLAVTYLIFVKLLGVGVLVPSLGL